MSLLSAAAIYFVLWWVTLFAVLPFGVRSQVESGEGVEGTDPGAPVLARMGWKVLWTTLVSAAIMAAGVWAHHLGYLNVERITRMFGFPF
jgi:predicted secreted protein